MIQPQDLPGRVVHAVDRLLALINSPGVVGDGWAVWRHGYVGRVTQDLDVALPADRIDEFLRVASVSGFEILPQPPGRWPKLVHKDTGAEVDVLPEGGRPGTPKALAPATIPYPREMGASGQALSYMTLAALVQLKLGAGRARDECDVVELIRANPEEVEGLRQHLASVHADYVVSFDALVQRAREQDAT